MIDWLQAPAWVGAESHRVLFDRTVDHLIASKVLLPGASVLWRVVGAVRQRANELGWTLVAEPLTESARERLLALLVAAGDGGDTPSVRAAAGIAGRRSYPTGRRHKDLGELRRLATLAAFATLTEQAAQDEVLDHVHTVCDDIEHRAQAPQRSQRLQSAPVIDTAGLPLAGAATPRVKVAGVRRPAART